MVWKKIKKQKDTVFGVFIATLITLLFIDRAFHRDVIAPITTLGAYLETMHQEQLLTRIGTSVPLFAAVPTLGCPADAIGRLSPKLALVYTFSKSTPTVENFLEHTQRLHQTLTGNYRPLPILLSDTFIELNRFIQTRKGLAPVEDSLRALSVKFHGSPLTLPDTLMSSLEKLQQQINAFQCHWHQSNPLTQTWSFAGTGEFNFFPPKSSSVPHSELIERYLQAADVESPFPLWVQSTEPRDDIAARFSVRTRPEMGSMNWAAQLTELQRAMDQLTPPKDSTLKTVSWQLRNLTSLIDKAASRSPLEANAIFIDTVTIMNDRLKSLKAESGSELRWNELAQDLMTQDLQMMEVLSNLRTHTILQTLPADRADVEGPWELSFRSHFDQAKYWIFPKDPIHPRQRLEIVLEELKRSPDISLSPETAWIYWWVHGHALERAHITFQWRQLMLGVAIGMTLLLWSLKKLYSS